MFDKIVVLLSLGVSLLSIIANIIITQAQTKKNQNFETEKICLELFAEFLAFCIKKSNQTLNVQEQAMFLKLNTKLSLIADKEITSATKSLIAALDEKRPKKEIDDLIYREKNVLQKKLEIFNSKTKK